MLEFPDLQYHYNIVKLLSIVSTINLHVHTYLPGLSIEEHVIVDIS